MRELTPREIVQELDKHIVGQDDAKRAVAVALRNRWRWMQLPDEIRKEIIPKNIIMIGPTGVGKTEITRRLANLTGAPFVKVEATKYTEVGYYGRDVESMVRDLVELAIKMVEDQEREMVRPRAEEVAEEHLLELLAPPPNKPAPGSFAGSIPLPERTDRESEPERENYTRERFREMLRAGQLEERFVDVEVAAS